MKIEKETQCYNERRFGKPWIALVDFSTSNTGTFVFGDWCGDRGDEGILIINAEPGNIVAFGQKDNRNSRNSKPEFYKVRNDGTLMSVSSKAEAYKESKNKH